MSKEKQILQFLRDGYSQRHIASTLGASRNTVSRVAKAAGQHPVPEENLRSIEEKEVHLILFPEEAQLPSLPTPGFAYIHKELLKSGETLKLLWEEYMETCRSAGQPPYGYSQYCKLYQDYVAQNKLTMHIQHKPDDKLMVVGQAQFSHFMIKRQVTATRLICSLRLCRLVCIATHKPAGP